MRPIPDRRRSLSDARFWPLLLLVALPLEAAGPRFQSDVQPLLKERCGACHSAKAKQGGLSVETRDDLVKGGHTGAAVVPGKPVDSLLLAMIASGRMPMGGEKLAAPEEEMIRAWIEGGALDTDETVAEVAVPEKEIFTSILGAKCFVCHGRRMQEAGLDLRTREGLLHGGKSGPALVPGNPEESLIVKRIAAQEMPPPHLQERYSVRGLTSDEFDKLKRWIASGAPPDGDRPLAVEPRSDRMVQDKDRQFWAFQPPARPPAPRVKARERLRQPVDAFVLSKLEAKGLSLAPEADKLVLLRRAYLDITGLPPSAEEVAAYRDSRDPQAYEKLIERLLASPHYGERWARYWLDAAGYADSEGGVSNDTVRPDAWRYRDYVIKSLNEDKPYDKFLIEQLAGDELFDYKAAEEYTPDQIEKLAATGFLRMAPDPTYSTEQNFIPERLDTLANEIDILGSSVMGLTVGCARCHDHKYDPIPQRDYYRLSAIFRPAYDPWDWRVPNRGCVGVGASCTDEDVRILPLKSESERAEVARHNQPIEEAIAGLEKRLEQAAAPFREIVEKEKWDKLPEGVREDLKKALAVPAEKRSEVERYVVSEFEPEVTASREELRQRFPEFRDEADGIARQINAEKRKLKPAPAIRAMFDMGGEPTPVRMLLRGEFTNPGALVEPGPPSVLSAGLELYRVEKPPHSSGTSGRRLAFAKWLVQPEHPLTARVMVNRIWQAYFGEGLVRSPANFGRTGMAPTHPELLDWLATELVRQGWSLKAIHRAILLSSTYRQSSRASDASLEADPGNELLSRFPLRRLDADSLRDSLLRVAGRLDTQAGGPPVEIEQRPDGEVIAKSGPAGERRTIYLLQRRSQPVTMLNVFDAPLLSPNCIRRGQSTVASQALNLTNSELVRSSARYLAGRVIDAAGSDPTRRVERMYLAIYGRAPTAEEQTRVQATLEGLAASWRQRLEEEKPQEPIAQKADWMAVAAVCHTLLNSAEFIYVD